MMLRCLLILSFLAFAMAHHFEWWLPDFPPEIVSSTTNIPVNELSEERGSEDEIEKTALEFSIVTTYTQSHYDDVLYGDVVSIIIPSPPPRRGLSPSGNLRRSYQLLPSQLKAINTAYLHSDTA